MSSRKEPQVGDWYLVADELSGVGPKGSVKNHRFIVRDTELLRVIVLLRTGEIAAYGGRVHPFHTPTCQSFDCRFQNCSVATEQLSSFNHCNETGCLVNKCGVIVAEPLRSLNAHDLGQYSCHETDDDTIEWLMDVKVAHQGAARRGFRRS